MKLNVGCGSDIRKDWVNADKFAPNVDAVLDFDSLESWRQFKDNYFDEVLAQHVIEHSANPTQFMEQIYRVSKPNAVVKIVAPHFSLLRSIGNLEHYRAGIGINTFVYLEPNYRRAYLSGARFKRINYSLRVEGWFKPITQWLADKFPRFYEHRIARFIPIEEITIKLQVVK